MFTVKVRSLKVSMVYGWGFKSGLGIRCMLRECVMIIKCIIPEFRTFIS